MAVLKSIYGAILVAFAMIVRMHEGLATKLGDNSWRVYPVYLALFGVAVSGLFYRDIFWWNMGITAVFVIGFNVALHRGNE